MSAADHLARFTAPSRRAISAGLALLLGIALVVAVLMPLGSWRAAVLARKAAEDAELARLGATRLRLTAERDLLSGAVPAVGIWPAAPIGEVTARIQSELSALSRDSGVSLHSVAPTGPKPLASAATVGFRLEAQARLDQLSDFLRALEFHSPPILIAQAQLRRIARPGDVAEQPLVFFQLDLIAPVAQSPDVREGG